MILKENEAIEKIETAKLKRQIGSELADVIIKSLRKQVPHYPDHEGDGYVDEQLVYDTWICPDCGKRYEVDYDNYDYCPYCGQRLYWDESEV